VIFLVKLKNDLPVQKIAETAQLQQVPAMSASALERLQCQSVPMKASSPLAGGQFGQLDVRVEIQAQLADLRSDQDHCVFIPKSVCLNDHPLFATTLGYRLEQCFDAPLLFLAVAGGEFGMVADDVVVRIALHQFIGHLFGPFHLVDDDHLAKRQVFVNDLQGFFTDAVFGMHQRFRRFPDGKRRLDPGGVRNLVSSLVGISEKGIFSIQSLIRCE
jgi:hypothetical protein